MADNDAFTEREQKVMALAWQCFAEQPKIDFEKLARLSGYTNVRSASNAWGAIKKKLASQASKFGAGDSDVNGDNESSATPKTTPKATPKKRGKKAADEDDGEETPAKKTKGRKGKATPKKADTDEDSAEGAPVVKAETESDDDGLLRQVQVLAGLLAIQKRQSTCMRGLESGRLQCIVTTQEAKKGLTLIVSVLQVNLDPPHEHHSIKKKIDALSEGAAMKGGSNGANEGSETGAAATPSKASGKKRKSDAIKTEGEDDDDAEAEGTPAKTPKKGRKSSTKVQGKASAATEEDGEKDEGQEMPSDDVKSEPNEQSANPAVRELPTCLITSLPRRTAQQDQHRDHSLSPPSKAGGHSDGPNPRQPVSPPLSPAPSTLPSPSPVVPPSRGSCVFNDHTDPAVYEFSKIRNFTFMELMESSNYITGSIIGRIRIKPAESDQTADLKLSVTYATTGPWKVERPAYYMTDDKFVLQLPELKSMSTTSTQSRACLGVHVDMEIKNGLRLENWELASGNLDVTIADGLFNRKPGEEKLSVFDVNKHSIFNLIRGTISAEHWSSRETEIDVISGSIKGNFALRDLLSLKTHSGSVRVNADPKDADPENIKPANFLVATSSGSVRVEFPTKDLPLREYQTRIETQSGSVGGTYILGVFTSFHTQSGSVKPRLIPVFNSTTPSQLHIDTQSASQTISILTPHQYPGAFAQLLMEHKYTSSSGSLHLTYPQEWEGYIEGETVSGSIHVKGKDVHVLSQGRVGHVYEHFVARKGFGQGRVGFKTSSGSVNIQVGDL
ncbi:uncharacterized protein MYCFIDRAFT_85937 [Pseudocercospora fijiensis CIRAD86]|uniref:Uncharacterized protein n=1 Tax=Pseudocercospora fijiensis (strain CIRAD86) TaxID=383855 RepID=N1Q6K2_PSEFD|nr:uncharacterized protein MYCFIDRAFT_85937 [Pseudocercospora fijiensis CIRAD86]EME88039.1 hypothetical protein MYCFIDRAFT_85937 [Pseudocercospora fijiensis CIRAD86]